MPAPKRSKIGFADYSGGDLNFCIGCTPVSESCRFCWAKVIYDRFGKDFSKVTVYPDKLERLLKWQPKPPYKRGPGSRPLAFVVNMGDLFHKEVPFEFIDDVWGVMAARSDVDWLVLTKRPQRLYEWYYQTDFLGGGDSRRNIWLGVTVENEDATWRIVGLRETPATVRWVSLEPMLGAIDPRALKGMSWVVIGAESGPNRRLFKKEWAWDVLNYCRAKGIPCFLKQDSGPGPGVPLLDREGRTVKEWAK